MAGETVEVFGDTPADPRSLGAEQVLEWISARAAEGADLVNLYLQRDTFWVYTRARYHFGTWREACAQAGSPLPKNATPLSDLSQRIDWWRCEVRQSRRESFGTVLHYLYREGVDVSATGLKGSPYFDLYTDACNLFGSFNNGLEYADIPVEQVAPGEARTNLKTGLFYPDNADVLENAVSLYRLDESPERNKRLAQLRLREPPVRKIAAFELDRSNVLVDGANLAYGRGREPSLHCLQLVEDEVLRLGFGRSQLRYFFDAAFRYRLAKVSPADAIEYEDRFQQDTRYSQSPAGEQADALILRYGVELLERDPSCPPLILSNDGYRDYFTAHPALAKLQPYKQGVTFVEDLGGMRALITPFRPGEQHAGTEAQGAPEHRKGARGGQDP